MNELNDGGPAFPVPPDSFGPGGETARPFEGMSLRDWFAGMALQGMAASSEWAQNFDASEAGTSRWLPEAAKVAYAASDAMLQVRKPKDQP